MKKFLSLAIFIVGLAHGQINTSYVSPNSPQFPISVGNILYADAFPGVDLAAKIANAFASVAGIPGAPRPSATVMCSPGQSYVVTSGPISVPRSDMPPFIQAPIIDCQNSTIYDGRANSASPLVDVGPTNALNGGVGSGMFINATLAKDSSAGPVMQMTDRLGYTVRNVFFYGGKDSLRMTSAAATTYTGEYVTYPYLEQNHFENIGITNCGRYGIYEETLAGGTGSHLYNEFQVKFDLDGACTTGIYIDGGSQASGSTFHLAANTGGGSTYHIITVDGQLISTNVYITGEPTGNPGATVYLVDGASYSHPTVFNNFRGNVSYGPLSRASLPLGCASDENYFLGRTGAICLGSNLDVLFAHGGGVENNSHALFRSCTTTGSTSPVGSGPCYNVLWMDSSRQALFGAGWFDTAEIPAMLPSAIASIAGHSLTLVPYTPASGGLRRETGWIDQGSAGFIHFVTGYDEKEFHYDAAGTVTASGTKFTGTGCTLPVDQWAWVNGALTNCK